MDRFTDELETCHTITGRRQQSCFTETRRGFYTVSLINRQILPPV